MNISFRILNIGCSFFNLSRGFSVCVRNAKSWNPVLDGRHGDLGRSMIEMMAVEVMVRDFTSLPTKHVNDISIGITKSAVLNTTDLPSERDIENQEDLSILLGSLQLKNQKTMIDSLSDAIKKDIYRVVSSPSIIQQLIISQHPKALLDHFSKLQKQTVRLSSYYKTGCGYEAKVFVDDVLIWTAENWKQSEAERMACLETLNQLYANDLKNFDVDNFDFPLEEEIVLGLGPNKKRIIDMNKSLDEPFGITIRGGEQKMIRNEEYIQYHTITPIFISHIQEGSPADKYDLNVGDIILAVNDHSLKKIVHKEAVRILKKFSNRENVSFTVKFDKNELLKHEAERDLLSRQQNRISQEMSDRRFNKWHHAKAKSNPEQYLVGKIEHKKREFQAKNSRKAVRLWDYRDYRK